MSRFMSRKFLGCIRVSLMGKAVVLCQKKSGTVFI